MKVFMAHLVRTHTHTQTHTNTHAYTHTLTKTHTRTNSASELLRSISIRLHHVTFSIKQRLDELGANQSIKYTHIQIRVRLQTQGSHGLLAPSYPSLALVITHKLRLYWGPGEIYI